MRFTLTMARGGRTAGMAERLYGRFCLHCGFVVHGLFEKRPWPITRRCKLCQPLGGERNE